MNILILSDGFPPLSNAGAENMAYVIAQEYKKQGHLVHVITINSELKNGDVKKISYEELVVHQVGSSYNRHLVAYVSLYNPWVLSAIKDILSESNFEFAHLHNIHAHISYSVISLLKDHKMKLILSLHDAMSIEYGKFTQGINSNDLSNNPKVNKKINPFKSFMNNKKSYNPFRNTIIKYFLKKVNKVVTDSYELKLLLNANGIENLEALNSGIPSFNKRSTALKINSFREKYNINETDHILFWAGRLSEAKGSIQVIQVLEKLIQNNYNVKLFVAGKKIFKGHKLEKHMIFADWLNMEDMSKAYNITDITLVPSICYDMFPTVILESMQEGTPVIATCFGGSKEAVVHGETGYIVNPFDIENFYEKICKILDNNQLQKTMALNCVRVFQDKFTVEICANKYFKIMESL